MTNTTTTRRHLTPTLSTRTTLCNRRSRNANAVTWTPRTSMTPENTCPACLAAHDRQVASRVR